MKRGLLLGFRIVSYAALAVVSGGVAAVAAVSLSGACPRFDEGAVQCTSPIFEAIAGTGLLVVLFAAFTGVPAVLALAGLVFLLRDVLSLARRGRAPTAG